MTNDEKLASLEKEARSRLNGDRPETSAPMFSGGAGGAGGATPSPERLEAVGPPHNGNGASGADWPTPVPYGYRVGEDGVFAQTGDPEKPEEALTHKPCGVIALCRDGDKQNWGAYLGWIDQDDHPHEIAVPVGRFHEPGGTLAVDLANLGLPIVPGMEKRLLRYFANCRPQTRFQAAIQTGWHDGVFVLPYTSLGNPLSGERLVYQPERYAATRHSVRSAGSLEGWQAEVAVRCAGNSVLVFWVSTSLAAPLLHVLNQEGGGFHLYGLTSMGKTTAELVAASVWGDGTDPAQGKGSSFTRKWNLTKNATEGLAEAHNDLPLLLDEIGEADAKEFGRTIYQLAGGQGKGRMRADATMKAPKTWRTLLLSTGEMAAADVIESEGRQLKGGQAVRLLDIPASDGIVLKIHGASSAAAFVDDLKRACGVSYGWAGPEFVKAILCEGLDSVRTELQGALSEATKALTPEKASAEIGRAVMRFALVAVAGEKAISMGLLPWEKGEALQAAKAMLNRHLLARDGAGTDTERALRQIGEFLLEHGSTRFRDLANEKEETINLAGFRDSIEGYFYFTPKGFREACKGHNPQEVARLLKERGFLRAPDGKHLTTKVRVPGMERPRLYAVQASILNGPDEAEQKE